MVHSGRRKHPALHFRYHLPGQLNMEPGGQASPSASCWHFSLQVLAPLPSLRWHHCPSRAGFCPLAMLLATHRPRRAGVFASAALAFLLASRWGWHSCCIGHHHRPHHAGVLAFALAPPPELRWRLYPCAGVILSRWCLPKCYAATRCCHRACVLPMLHWRPCAQRAGIIPGIGWRLHQNCTGVFALFCLRHPPRSASVCPIATLLATCHCTLRRRQVRCSAATATSSASLASLSRSSSSSRSMSLLLSNCWKGCPGLLQPLYTFRTLSHESPTRPLGLGGAATRPSASWPMLHRRRSLHRPLKIRQRLWRILVHPGGFCKQTTPAQSSSPSCCSSRACPEGRSLHLVVELEIRAGAPDLVSVRDGKIIPI
jgi:hypothetical protein